MIIVGQNAKNIWHARCCARVYYIEARFLRPRLTFNAPLLFYELGFKKSIFPLMESRYSFSTDSKAKRQYVDHPKVGNAWVGLMLKCLDILKMRLSLIDLLTTMFVAIAVAAPTPNEGLYLDTSEVEFQKRVSTPAEPVGISSGGVAVGGIL